MVHILHHRHFKSLFSDGKESLNVMSRFRRDTPVCEWTEASEATTPFTVKELEDLEKSCGLHVNHLLRFVESVINQAKTQEAVVSWNNLVQTFHRES